MASPCEISPLAAHNYDCISCGCGANVCNKSPNCLAMLAVWTLKDLRGKKFGQVNFTAGHTATRLMLSV